jgi:hypothetical protein
MTAARGPQAVFREAVELMRQGKYEDALRNHLWFHEHALEHNPALAGVRLSYALAAWVELGEKYPPALRALTSIRDEKAKALAGGNGTFAAFHDVAAINESLKESPATAALFQAIHQAHPRLAGQCYRVAEPHLLAQREYAICASYIPDAQARFDEIGQLFRLQMEIAGENPSLGSGGLREYAAASFVVEVCRLIEVLVGVSRGEEAERVRALALAFSPGAGARDALDAAFRGQEPGYLISGPSSS